MLLELHVAGFTCMPFKEPAILGSYLVVVQMTVCFTAGCNGEVPSLTLHGLLTLQVWHYSLAQSQCCNKLVTRAQNNTTTFPKTISFFLKSGSQNKKRVPQHLVTGGGLNEER